MKVRRKYQRAKQVSFRSRVKGGGRGWRVWSQLAKIPHMDRTIRDFSQMTPLPPPLLVIMGNHDFDCSQPNAVCHAYCIRGPSDRHERHQTHGIATE